MNPLRKNDVLASNLLFVNLLLTVGDYLFWWGIGAFAVAAPSSSTAAVATPAIRWAVVWAVVFLLLRAGLYYAVRRGVLRAKLLVAFCFLGAAYFTTQWQYRYIAGINFRSLEGYSMLVLVEHLLTLAALMLMFKKPRVAAAPSGT